MQPLTGELVAFVEAFIRSLDAKGRVALLGRTLTGQKV